MYTKSDCRDIVIKQGLLPLFYYAEAEVCLQLVETLYNAGIRAIEYTNRGEAALNNFIYLKQAAAVHYPGLLLGIGTIKTTEAAKSFLDAGADFFVSPGISPSLVQFFALENVLWIPGCATVSEIMMAEENGISLVKLFPGSLLRPSFVASVRELFPAVHFMPTGGVDTSISGLEEWFAAGVSAVGIGNKLITAAMVENKQYETLTTSVSDILSVIDSLKVKYAKR